MKYIGTENRMHKKPTVSINKAADRGKRKKSEPKEYLKWWVILPTIQKDVFVPGVLTLVLSPGFLFSRKIFLADPP